MELDTMNRELFVLQAHNFALGRLGRDFEAVRQAGALDQQRMIAGSGKRDRQAGEHALSGMLDRRELAVHLARRADDVASEKLANRLVPEAHAQHGLLTCKSLDHVETYTGI